MYLIKNNISCIYLIKIYFISIYSIKIKFECIYFIQIKCLCLSYEYEKKQFFVHITFSLQTRSKPTEQRQLVKIWQVKIGFKLDFSCMYQIMRGRIYQKQSKLNLLSFFELKNFTLLKIIKLKILKINIKILFSFTFI